MLARMARRKRPQPIEQAASAFLASVLAADHPDHAVLEAAHALVDALGGAGLLDGDSKHWHEALSAKRTLAGDVAPRPPGNAVAPKSSRGTGATTAERRAMLDAMLAKRANGTLSDEDTFRTRMLILGLESGGAIDEATADALLREVPACRRSTRN